MPSHVDGEWQVYVGYAVSAMPVQNAQPDATRGSLNDACGLTCGLKVPRLQGIGGFAWVERGIVNVLSMNVPLFSGSHCGMSNNVSQSCCAFKLWLQSKSLPACSPTQTLFKTINKYGAVYDLYFNNLSNDGGC